MKRRLDWVDMARFLAIFMIVLGHAVNGASALNRYFSSFKVPLFFVLSGVTFHAAPTLRADLKKRALRLLVPYGVFALVSILIFAAATALFGKALPSEGIASTQVVPNLLGALYANGLSGYMKWNLPLWFLPCCFVTLILVGVFERAIQGKRDKLLPRLLFMGACLLFTLLHFYCFERVNLPLQAECAPFMACFAEEGILFSQFMRSRGKTRLAGKSLAIGCPALLALSLVSAHFCGGASVMSHRYGHDPILFLASATLSSFAFLLLAMALEARAFPLGIRRALSWAGRHTVAILCMHKFPILLFQAFVPFTRRVLNLEGDSLIKNAAGILVSLIAIALCLLAERPLAGIAPWAFGESQRKTK